MFHVGDYIVYGSNGICRVEEITHPDIAGIDENKLYYVLVPEKTRDSRLFCPTDNSRVVLRSVITAEEAAALMEEVREIAPLQVESERMRDDSYKKAMKSCDLRQWVQVIKALLIRKEERRHRSRSRQRGFPFQHSTLWLGLRRLFPRPIRQTDAAVIWQV